MHLVSEVPPIVAAVTPRNAQGLRERMKAAKTVEELNLLRALGKSYTSASKDTHRRWQNTYNKRLQELSA